jgi:uncharacterized membrane protein YgcG
MSASAVNRLNASCACRGDRLNLVRRILRHVSAVLAGFVIAVPLLGAAIVTTGVQDFEFESYSADYYLSRDDQGHSTLRTVETFVAVFPNFDQNRGMIRAIPNDYDGVPLHTSVQSVVDEHGNDVPYESSVYDDFTELALGTDEYVHGRTTYTISYTQQNVVRAFTDTNDDEFYWDTNGTGFNQPFGSVTARVHIDPALSEFLTGNNACYQGESGSTDTCQITLGSDADGDVLTASARNLDAGGNLTVAIGFTLGTFLQVPAEVPNNSGGDPYPSYQPDPGDAPWWAGIGSIVVAVLAALGTAFTIVWRFITPKSAKGRGIIIPQYTVPKDLNLLEAADIIGRRWSGVPAQIVSFAVRGKLRILDYPVTSGGAKYTLQLLDDSGLDDEERELLLAIFGSLEYGVVQEVGVVDDAAASAISSVSVGVRKRVMARGFKQKRTSWVGFILAGCMFLLIFVAFTLLMTSAFFRAESGWSFLAVVLTFFAVFLCLGFAWRPAALTEVGAEQRDYLLGMKDYLQLAEADRFRMLQSPEGALRVRAEGLDPAKPADKVKLYEKLLPFAVLWGVEREWAKELTVAYGDTAPDWFVSRTVFDPYVFASAISTISSSSVARSTPTTSSGSSWSGSGGGSFSGGSSGGGFSGGGGGGGGGGGR